MMLAQLLATGECLVQSVSFTAAASELVDLVEGANPTWCAFPPRLPPP